MKLLLRIFSILIFLNSEIQQSISIQNIIDFFFLYFIYFDKLFLNLKTFDQVFIEQIEHSINKYNMLRDDRLKEYRIEKFINTSSSNIDFQKSSFEKFHTININNMSSNNTKTMFMFQLFIQNIQKII